MTTLVYRDGVLAADSRITVGDTYLDGWRKVRRISDGSLVGFTGSLPSGQAFIDWATNGFDGPPPKGEYSGVLISSTGKIVEFEDGSPIAFPKRSLFQAWGSGRQAALGALHMGATAVEAVKIANKINNTTGGRVHSLKLSR